MNDPAKSQNDTAKPEKQARGMIDKLEAVDRRITSEHLARRFRELQDVTGDNTPDSATSGDNTVASRPESVRARPARAIRSTPAARGISDGRTLLADHPESLQSPQGAFFDADGAVGAAETGYGTPTVAAAAGVTSRQLNYWARTGLVKPNVRAAHGSGFQPLYSFRDVLVLKVVKRLLDTGISLQQIRAAVEHLRDHETADLAQVTLMSDGVSVYECTSPDEVVDLLAGGQGVFGIALGRVWQEVAQKLGESPATAVEDGLIAADPTSPATGASQGDPAKSYLHSRAWIAPVASDSVNQTRCS